MSKSIAAFFTSAFLVGIVQFSFAQTISGTVENKSRQFVEYVNIGVPKKNHGTVSDERGKFSLNLDGFEDSDTLMLSRLGFNTLMVSVKQAKAMSGGAFVMVENQVNIKEVVIRPRKFSKKRFGTVALSKMVSAGYSENKLGYELGVLMKSKKTATLEKLHLNFANCTYDSIFYRVNVYKKIVDGVFQNILDEPIYMSLPGNMLNGGVQMDLSSYNITVKGEFLVSLEQVRDLGKGHLNFCSKLFATTYFRQTSQGVWQSLPVGVSISVDALVEK